MRVTLGLACIHVSERLAGQTFCAGSLSESSLTPEPPTIACGVVGSLFGEAIRFITSSPLAAQGRKYTELWEAGDHFVCGKYGVLNFVIWTGDWYVAWEVDPDQREKFYDRSIFCDFDR